MKIAVVKDLDGLRASALARLDGIMRVKRAAIVGTNGDIHALKVAEAQTVGVAGTPILDAEAKLSGISPRDIASTILDRHARQTAAIADLETRRQRLQSDLRAANTPAAIAAIIAQEAES